MAFKRVEKEKKFWAVALRVRDKKKVGQKVKWGSKMRVSLLLLCILFFVFLQRRPHFSKYHFLKGDAA